MHRVLIALLLSSLTPATGAAQETPTVATIERLAWLAGSWRAEKAGRVTDEQWMAPAGGVMLGAARTVARGRVVEHEFLQIRVGPGGELFYVAQPARQKEAAFKASSQTDTGIVFENREHDFPQVIGYRLNSDGSLLAWVEGVRSDGTTRRMEHAYRRTGR